MEMFGITGVAAILVIAYLIGLIAKAIPDLDNKWIPVICGLSGAILGAVSFAYSPIPDFPAKDIITAIAVGIVSGLGATGVNQAVKQLSKPHKNEEV